VAEPGAVLAAAAGSWLSPCWPSVEELPAPGAVLAGPGAVLALLADLGMTFV
jgi:hypothetical protein